MRLRTCGALVPFALVAAFSAGCAPRRRVEPPRIVIPPPVVATLDPHSVALLERCARGADTAQAQSSDALVAMARQRLVLVERAATLRDARAEIERRIQRARIAARAIASSDRENAQLSSAIIDMADGREPAAALPKRIIESDAYKDLVDAHAVLSNNRADEAKVQSQIEGIDQIVATLGTTGSTSIPVTIPPAHKPADGRPIEPAL